MGRWEKAEKGFAWMEDSTAFPTFGPASWGPLASAFEAFHGGDVDAALTIYTDGGEPESMPVSLFFRSPEQFREVDRIALTLVRGRVLDVGAGVGSVTLALQEAGVDVTALEVIPEAVAVMTGRGVRAVLQGSVLDLPPDPTFDTLLLLMNGLALAGTQAGIGPLLQALEGFLAPGGQVLLDSTDLTAGDGAEPGELHYQIEFQGRKGAPFPQLFLDSAALRRMAGSEGWIAEKVWEGEDGEYLARLSRAPTRKGVNRRHSP